MKGFIALLGALSDRRIARHIIAVLKVLVKHYPKGVTTNDILREIEQPIPYSTVVVTLRRLRMLQLVEKTVVVGESPVYVLTPEKCKAYFERIVKELGEFDEEEKKSVYLELEAGLDRFKPESRGEKV